MKRKTTKHHSKSHQSVLRARVITKRTVWFGFLKYTGNLIKLACMLGIISGAGWGVWRGIEHAFFKNPDFRLRVINLNPNPVIDEIGIAAAAGINLSESPNLFEIDVKEVTRRLTMLPEIAEARVEKHPPGTLFVRVIPRSPAAWISSNEAGWPQARQPGAMLVDRKGVAYPCPPLLAASTTSLPVIELPPSAGQPIKSGKKIRQPELEHCFLLLDAAKEEDPESLRWIDSIRQVNSWSLLVKTRQGTSATFGLGDHARQIGTLRAALDHAGEKGYTVDTINLIPKYNVPITVRNEAPPPKARPVPENESPDNGKNRRSRDLDNILHRN
jgi:hypothetical protein